MGVFSKTEPKPHQATISVAEAQALMPPVEATAGTPTQKPATEVVVSHGQMVFEEDRYAALAAAAILAAPDLPVVVEHDRQGGCCAEPWDSPPQHPIYARSVSVTRLIAALDAIEPGSGANLRVTHRPEPYHGWKF